MISDQRPDPPARGRSSRRGARRVRSGIDTARQAVEMASSVLDEVTAGMDEMTRRTIRAASASVGGPRRAAPGPSARPPAPAPRSAAAAPTGSTGADHGGTAADSEGPELAEQLLDLARQMMRLATDTAGRVLDVVAGPVERLVDPEARQDHEAWLSLGPVRQGRVARGTFFVVDDAGTGPLIGLKLVNPLASMGGDIPIEAVSFRRPGKQFAHTPAGPATGDPPWRVRVPAGEAVEVEVEVDVPARQAPGTYLGIVRSPDADDFHLVLEVQVT